MTEDDKKFEVKLPARITGLVFWGLVFIGLLLAVIVLRQAESNIIEDRERNAALLSFEVEEIIEHFSDAETLELASGRIRAIINRRMEETGFHALRISDESYTLSVGVVTDNDEAYRRTLEYFPRNSDKLKIIHLELFSESSKRTLAELRKNFLLAIGFGVFLFGMLLQRVLQKMLAEPFHRMVATAEEFSRGNEDVRFDETRPDEFGYLGRFINNAIDSILSHKNELLLALKRASDSELELDHEKERAEVTLYSITDSVITVDVNELITYINPAAEKLLHAQLDDTIGRSFKKVFRIVNENTGEEVDDPLEECFRSGSIIQLPEHSSLLTMRDEPVSIEASIAPMLNHEGDLMCAVIVIQDVSHTRRLTRQLSYQASHDLLTGLYNRRKFE